MTKGQLTIVEGAITDTDVSKDQLKETISFFRNIDDSVWGTACKEWADRNEKLGTQSEIIQVPAINFADCLRNTGCRIS